MPRQRTAPLTPEVADALADAAAADPEARTLAATVDGDEWTVSVEGEDTHPDDLPVYDERGNVRPRGTEGARHMSYNERVEIAQRLAAETA